jgi:hypothetical protein
MKRQLLLLFFTITIFTSYGQKLPFQGKLTSGGTPVTGARTFVFAIPTANWTETHDNVSVLDGFYSVVLGSKTPLPSSLFDKADEVQLTIKVDATQLSPVNIYAPIRGASADTIKTKSVQITNPQGKLRADLNYYSTTDAGSLVLYGANDSTKAILGTSNKGYSSGLWMYDSLRNMGAKITVGPKGGGLFQTYSKNSPTYPTIWLADNGSGVGFFQLTGWATDLSYKGGMGMGIGGGATGLPYFWMEGSSDDPYTTIIEYGITRNTNISSETPYFNLNTSKRVIDLKGPIVKFSAINDSEGPDPSGEAGELFIWGSNTPNFQLGANLYSSTNLPSFSMYGSKADGTGWFKRNLVLDTYVIGNNDINASSILLYNTSDTSAAITVDIASYSNGGSGQVKVRSSSNKDLVELHDRGGNTGEARFFGNDAGLKAEIGAFGDNSGFMILYGANGNKNIQIDRDPSNTNMGQINVFGADGITQRIMAGAATDGTNEWGFLNIDGPTGGITIDGNTGNITATGVISAPTITQTSDGRLKTNVSTLENALINTRKMRGVSYNWIDQNKSQANQIGVIAQEVEAIYPEFVHTDEKGMKAVNYAQMVGVLIEAIKELDAKVSSLEAQNSELKAQLTKTQQNDIETLKSEIESIKALLARPSADSPQLGSVNK